MENIKTVYVLVGSWDGSWDYECSVVLGVFGTREAAEQGIKTVKAVRAVNDLSDFDRYSISLHPVVE